MKILLAIDGSKASLEATRHVIALHQAGLNVFVILGNVQEPATLYEILFAKDMALIEQACAQAGLDILRAAAHLLDDAGISYEREVAKGDIANTLLDIAEKHQCEAIIMGTRGDSILRTAVLGSVTNELLHASNLPVTVVKYLEPEEIDSSALV